MANLSGSGEIGNVALAIQRLNQALMEFEAAAIGIEPMRSVPGILGVLASGAAFAGAFPYLPVGLRNIYLGCLDQLHSSPTEDRLADEIRGNGD